MKRRIIAVLLALCLFAGLAAAATPTASAAGTTLESSVNMDQLVAHGIQMFKQMEAGGIYNSVVNTSMGCVGMGILGWVGSSALQLLKWACAIDPTYCKSVLGEDLYNEIVNAPVADKHHAPNWDNTYLMPNWSYWRYRTFTATELAAAKTLLGSTVGVQAQNKLAGAYIRAQAQHGWNAGVRTEAALLYYCSAENHYGEGGVKNFMTKIRNALGITQNDTINSLREFHGAAVTANVDTLAYRTKVYKYIVNNMGLSQDPDPGSIPFTDMPPAGHWAHDAIEWAYTANPQITNGTSDTTFSPDGVVTRGEAVTFLWRAAGKPNPGTSNPFTDVKSDKFYYNAVLWAVKMGITNGTSDTTFSPNEPVTRAQMLTLLWRYAGKPNPGQNNNPYTDTENDKFYTTAVNWAYWGGILVGNEGGSDPHKLLPNLGCSRAYVVTYLYDLFVMVAH